MCGRPLITTRWSAIFALPDARLGQKLRLLHQPSSLPPKQSRLRCRWRQAAVRRSIAAILTPQAVRLPAPGQAPVDECDRLDENNPDSVASAVDYDKLDPAKAMQKNRAGRIERMR